MRVTVLIMCALAMSGCAMTQEQRDQPKVESEARTRAIVSKCKRRGYVLSEYTKFILQKLATTSSPRYRALCLRVRPSGEEAGQLVHDP